VARRDTVVLYRGFGTSDRVYVFGRALEEQRLAPAGAADSRFRNLMAMLDRADADPLPHADVSVSVGSARLELTADDEGFFAGEIPADHARRIDDDWIEVHAQLVSTARGRVAAPVAVAGSALCPSSRPEYLVVSDIDDTVLQSRVTSFLRAAQTLAFGNARTRLPFPGVAAFYTALRRGRGARGHNPIFYVSSSPWNLYDVITEFLEFQGIPLGPVMLRDLDIDLGTLSSRRHHDHKGDHIRRILATYPDLPVILIGDSGQQDPEIYHGIVKELQGRVRAIYIRNVTMNAERSAAIDRLAKEVIAAGSTMVLADDTLTAAHNAVEHGLIPPEALAGIGEDKRADEGATPEKAAAPGSRDAEDGPTPTVVVERRPY
jgi:phosphatidate phosphatase APP1